MATKTEPTLLKELADRTEGVAEIAKGLREHDAAGTTASVAGLIATLATGIPVLGKLAEEGARWVFARTAYARLEKVAAEINRELDQAAQEKRIAESVAQLVGQSLLKLGEEPAQVTSLVGVIDPQLSDFGDTFAAEYVRVEQALVDGGSTGVELSEPKGREVAVVQQRVTGRGTVGVKL